MDADFDDLREDLIRSLESIPTSPDLLGAIQTCATVQEQAERLLTTAVARARAQGMTWADIGTALGISRQGAFQRFGRPIDPRTEQPMDTTPLAGVEPRAVSLFALLAAGQWEAARADFDATMTAQLPADRLADNFATVVSMVGEFQHTGAPHSRREGAYTVVDVPLAFEAGDMTGRVAFADSGEVAGLFILDPSYAADH